MRMSFFTEYHEERHVTREGRERAPVRSSPRPQSRRQPAAARASGGGAEWPTQRDEHRKRSRAVCPHNHQRSECKESRGGGGEHLPASARQELMQCPHQRIRSTRKECGGASICPSQRIRSRCKECEGSSICPHQRIKSRCQECRQEADESMPAGLEELEGASCYQCG